MSPIERSAGGGGTSSGGLTLLFDQELTVAAATIDTGANGIAQTGKHLYFEIYARSANAVNGDSLGLRFNNDSAANYDDAYMRNSSGAVSAASDQGQTSAFVAQITGSLVTANYFGTGHGNVMSYAETTAGFKSGNCMTGFARDNVNVQQITIQYLWRSTAAITRMAIFLQGGGNMVIGSRLTIYGTP